MQMEWHVGKKPYYMWLVGFYTNNKLGCSPIISTKLWEYFLCCEWFIVCTKEATDCSLMY